MPKRIAAEGDAGRSAVIQMSEAPAGPPPVMIQRMVNELRLVTSSSRTVISVTPFRCGTVTCQKRFQALAPSTWAARCSWSGTVCRPASIMIMAKGNSFQTLTTISDGITRSMLSRKTIWPSMMPECDRAMALITP